MTPAVARGAASPREVPPVRQVRFDLGGVPLAWIPDEPEVARFLDVVHTLLPRGEAWFVDVYRSALAATGDPEVRALLRSFMGQESVHGRAHGKVLADYLARHGVDVADATRFIDRLEHVFRDAPLGVRLPKALERPWLVHRLGLVAAAEQIFCTLGQWILTNESLAAAGADPAMLELLKWHGAEEVEHRTVAFEVHRAFGGTRAGRVVAMAVGAPLVVLLWTNGAWRLFRAAPMPARGGRPSLRRTLRRLASGQRRGLLPEDGLLGRAVLDFLKADYHPEGHGDGALAARYLATAPGVVRRASASAS